MSPRSNGKLDPYAKVIIAAVAVLYLLPSVFFSISHEHMGGFVVAIFVLPPIAVAWAINRFKSSTSKTFVVLILLCAAIHLLLWTAYMLLGRTEENAKVFEFGFYLCTGAGIFVIVFVLWVAYCILDGKNSKFIYAIGQHRFLTLMLFIGLFLYFTFFLTFALVFHDIGSSGPGLAVSLRTPWTQPSVITPAQNQAELDPIVRTLNFEKNTASLSYSKDQIVHCVLELSQNNSSEMCGKIEGMFKIAKEIAQYRRVRIVILGHATEETPGAPKFASNLELSEARASFARYLLNEIIQAYGVKALRTDVEWLIHAASSENVFLDSGNKLCVEVQVTPLEENPKLELLDYLYFMVYTVTTTGYGDMAPITPQSKFLTTFANLGELVFLVIFFNLFISGGAKDRAALQKKPRQNATASEGVDSSTNQTEKSP